MVRKSSGNQTVTDGVTNTGKTNSKPLKSEQQQRNRNNNTKGYQSRKQNNPRNSDTQNAHNRGGQANNKDSSNGSQNQGHQSGPRNNNHGSRSHDGYNKESNQSKGYYRDRNREDRDTQSRRHSSSSCGKHSNMKRNRAEETIDDIKHDILRLEKEIELEIREIRSLKFL